MAPVRPPFLSVSLSLFLVCFIRFSPPFFAPTTFDRVVVVVVVSRRFCNVHVDETVDVFIRPTSDSSRTVLDQSATRETAG